MHSQQQFLDSYLKPFRLVEQLELKCVYEKSFKLMDRHLLRNRYLLGIENTGLDNRKLACIRAQMGMPEKFADHFHANLADASLVLLGFEEGIDDCIYKIYLEFRDEIRQEASDNACPGKAATLFRGYKWSAFDNRQAALTEYLYYPRLEFDEIIARIESLLSLPGKNPVFAVTSEIVSLAASLATDEPMIYLEASEEGKPRRSFDINLYPAEMTLESIRPAIAQLFHHYQIAGDELELLYDKVGSRPLGHLSGGIDREGRSFFTVYYENQP